MNSFFDRLTGSEARLYEIYRSAFTEAEAERLMRKTKKQNRMIAILVLLIVAVMIISLIQGTAESEGREWNLARPGASDPPKTIEADVSAEYDGYTVKQKALVRILPREPSHDEAVLLIKEIERKLPALIAGENPSLNSVTEDLIFPKTDEDTGAELSWRSSNPRIVSNEGKVNLIGIKSGTPVALTAYIRLASAYDSFHIGIVTGGAVPEENAIGALKDRITEIVTEASNAKDGEFVLLPEETPDGVKLKWAPPENENGTAVLFICGIIVFFCFTQRYKTAHRNVEKARLEMERDYPDFVQKLGLLLGAGLVITSAISRIIEDYLSTREIYGERRLYEEIASAQDRMRAAGTPLVYEFSELARRSGLRELMRFSSTLSDNIDKGSTLADKLRAENELLWESRKKRAEQEGRVAETKLIFPMVLQILAIIAITVMPAAFEMN